MDPHYQQWLTLALRWLHVIAGVAWIGSSFYFNWLEGNLRPPKREQPGVAGEVWSVHGGGFYVVQKLELAPEELPKTLHWFKWEAYTTWLSGFALLVLVYYMSGPAYLIDANSPLSFPAAVAVGLSTLGLGWIVYDLVSSWLGERPRAFAAVGFALASAVAWGLTELLGSRAAYIHIGAMLGTIMAANVFFVIIPSQRELVGAKLEQRAPDPAPALRAKQRSLHNNYITLPVLFIMISNHYPVTYDHRFNWLVLALLSLTGAVIRHWFNLKNRGHWNRWMLPAAAAAMLALAFGTAPRSATQGAGGAPVAFSEVWAVIGQRCTPCHSRAPSDQVFTSAPNGVMFDTPEQISGYVAQIQTRVVATHNMPLANKTGMTEAERELIARWIGQGAPVGGGPQRPAERATPGPAAPPAVAKSPDLAAREYFQRKCVVCHGPRGQGDGPGASALSPRPRRLSDPAWQASVSDEHLEKVILGGGSAVGKSAAMPANPELAGQPAILSELVRLLRSFGS
jgi:uncharacterized membrane protein